MNARTGEDLYRRGNETLLACWDEYARGAVDAAVNRLPGVAAAVFPREPELTFYNNAVLERGLSDRERANTLDAMEAVYAAAGVHRFAAWVHECDEAMRRGLERRGYILDTATRAMGMFLDDITHPRPQIELESADWPEYLESQDLAPGFLKAADHAALHVLAAREQGRIISAALAYDFSADCGIYNVSTVEVARRRGLGTAITAAQLYGARGRGCVTASLQSTPMGEGVYRRMGFRDLGRILEYAPASA